MAGRTGNLITDFRISRLEKMERIVKKFDNEYMDTDWNDLLEDRTFLEIAEQLEEGQWFNLVDSFIYFIDINMEENK